MLLNESSASTLVMEALLLTFYIRPANGAVIYGVSFESLVATFPPIFVNRLLICVLKPA